MKLPIELAETRRLFDVLRNELNSELGRVLGVEGDKIAFKLKTGEIARFAQPASTSSASPRRRKGESPSDAVIAEMRRQVILARREHGLVEKRPMANHAGSS